ncbi:MAG: hypothetical protein OJF62_002513 [Pseudolabrys sp.]|jgi:hypothetical protein|nr:hypothetical protein [Pseudolabrys sp.]
MDGCLMADRRHLLFLIATKKPAQNAPGQSGEKTNNVVS